MTERRLPPALAEQEDEAGCWDEIESVVSTSAILDWLYGTATVCPSCGRKWEGNCKDPDCVGGRLGTPDIVQRVERRATDLYRTTKHTLQGAFLEALRAELGSEYPKPDGEQGDAASMEAGEVGG